MRVQVAQSKSMSGGCQTFSRFRCTSEGTYGIWNMLLRKKERNIINAKKQSMRPVNPQNGLDRGGAKGVSQRKNHSSDQCIYPFLPPSLALNALISVNRTVGREDPDVCQRERCRNNLSGLVRGPLIIHGMSVQLS